MSSMTIGELARRAGVGIETVRYYQRRGLLAEPPKPARGFRKYSDSVLQLLRFVRRAKGLGFSLKEIETLLALRQGRPSATNELMRTLSNKEQEIAATIRDLEIRQRALQRLLKECRSASGPERWRVFDGDAD